MDIVRLRYLGDDRVRVPKLGKVVEPDELVGVPADVVARYEWPESVWRREDSDPPPPPPPSGQQTPPADAGATTTTRTSRRGNDNA